jgi:hypothetical protein
MTTGRYTKWSLPFFVLAGVAISAVAIVCCKSVTRDDNYSVEVTRFRIKSVCCLIETLVADGEDVSSIDSINELLKMAHSAGLISQSELVDYRCDAWGRPFVVNVQTDGPVSFITIQSDYGEQVTVVTVQH